MRGALFAAAVTFCALTTSSCQDSEKKMAERQQALEAARAKEKEKAKESATAAEDKKPDRPLDPYWDDPDKVVIRHESPCPDGLWALFGGPAPGGDEETRKQNDARRAELARTLKAKTFVARLHGPEELKLQPYDAPKGHFPLELKGTIDCEDSIGRIAIAFTNARVIPMPTSSLSEGSPQMMWDAPPRRHQLPMKSMADAKSFQAKHQFGMEGYIVFDIAKTDTHRKMVRTAKETQGEVTIGGTTDDYGAGRLIRADVKDVRVLANPGPVVLVDTRDPAKVSLP